MQYTAQNAFTLTLDILVLDSLRTSKLYVLALELEKIMKIIIGN